VRTLATAALVVGILLVAAPTASAGRPSRTERALLTQINRARADHGLRPVRFSQPLQTRSHSYAVRLLRSDSFAHAILAPGTRENLAWATTNVGSMRQIVQMWLASPGHRTNLLWRGARRAGVGVARGEFQGYGDVRMAVLRLR
jgi:uncharacterized protein YkwD